MQENNQKYTPSNPGLYKIFSESSGICTDSRKAGKDQLFFALKGENFNGNLYARSAIDKGCSYAIIDDPYYQAGPQFILVPDCLRALQELAKTHRNGLKIPVIGITGSNGKTTTKELMAAVLRKKFKTYATKGNLNNHIGVPLSILEIDNEEIAIIEMGANHIGEIAALCAIADPDYGLITNIGRAHLEGFGSPEGVIQAKTELYRYLEKKSGLLFINGSNPLLVREASTLKVKKISYMSGENLLCDGYIERKGLHLNGFVKFTTEKETPFSTKMTGSYNLENILAAACVGKYFEVNEKDIVEAIRDYSPSNNRSQLIETGKNTVIMDAYNANPVSMQEAIDNFLEIEHPRKLMVLGDMLELGEWSVQEHQKVLKKIHNSGFSNLFLVGPCFAKTVSMLPFHSYKRVEDLIEHFKHMPLTQNLILLKASRGIGLEKVLEVL